MSNKFVHLHTHSHYSLLDGLAKIDELVKGAKELGMDSLALTDHGVLYGAVEFYQKAVKAGIKPILGVETYVAPRDRFSREPGEKYFHLVLLAENLTGWKNLIQLVTKAHLEGFYYRPRVDKDLLRQHHEGLIALSACLGGEVNRLLGANRFDDAKKSALEYQEIFGEGNFFLEVQNHPHNPDAVARHPQIVELARATGLPLVATQDVHYLRSEDNEYHDILLAVQTGSKLSDDDRLSMKMDDFSLLSPEQMIEKFKDVPEAIENTVKIAERCQAKLELHQILLPEFAKPDGKSAIDYLEELVQERLSSRFTPEQQTSEVLERLRYEMNVVGTTGFADYFLIVQDLINWAKMHGIAVGPGRGSAAGSLLSYILHITDINPLEYDLLFERFLNPERIQMPDIDIDFADTRRDEVLAYARQKYGEDRVAQIITFGTMAARAALRDAGRAMGFSYGFCDQIAKLIPFNPTQGMKEGWLDICLKNVPELKEMYEKNPDAKRLIDAARHLEGVARHASVHACGTVISKEPLTDYVPLQNSPQDKNIIITQFEMHSVEDLGLLKIDFLGLKNLTIIEDTVRLVRELHGEEIKISELPLDDAKTFELLQAGNTTGVFQFESSGMRRYMKEIKPTELEDLIALVALFRPGPMDLIPSFIARKHGREKISYLHPQLEPIMKNTYGIGVYQEQMMRIATDLGGYTLPEADTLRKAIGKKIKSLLDEQKDKLLDGMAKNGIDAKSAQAIWDLFPPFARYAFNKSHAACYALIGYRTAYLKAHYPEEFMSSLFNAELSDVDRIAFLISDAKQVGLEVLPPDITKSSISFAPEGKGKIRFGLLAIKNVGAAITEAIIQERLRGGAFTSFGEFLNRVQHKDLNKKSLESLIKAGVFDSLGVERNQALESIDDILKFTTTIRKNAQQSTASLFGAMPTNATLKLKEAPPATAQQKLAWEKELVGFYLSDHPLNSLEEKIKLIRPYPIQEVRAIKNEFQSLKVVGLISKVKKIVAKNGQPMVFATVEDFSPNPLEVVVFNSVLAKTATVWEQNNVVLVQGRMSWRNGEPSMLCDGAQVLEA